MRLGDRHSCIKRVAGRIVDMAWRGRGVRVFILPCTSIVVVPMYSNAEKLMFARYGRHLEATWMLDRNGRGPSFNDVVADLRYAVSVMP
jgi:hypothetical protein